MMSKKTLCSLLFFLFVSGCGDSDSDTKKGADPAESDTTYTVTFTSLWNATDHVSVPGNAHFSPLVVSVHNSNHSLFTVGSQASVGLESVAESGSTAGINAELEAEVSAGRVLRSKEAIPNFFFGPGDTVRTFEVSVNKNFPLVSFVSMIAPSPDWMVGQDGVELYTDAEGFVDDTGVINLFAYDGGTEGADTAGNYSLSGTDTVPATNVMRLTGSGFDQPFATIQFVKKN